VGLLAIFATSFLIGLSGAMMPGPLSALALVEGPRAGPMAGISLGIGHAFAELLVLLLLVLGLKTVLSSPLALGIIGISGGGVLMWMGVEALRLARRSEGAWLASGSSRSSPLRLPIVGITVTVSNPYWLLWWATIGAGYLSISSSSSFPGISSFYIGHILSDFSWLSVLSAISSKGISLNSRIYRAIVPICGIFLIAMAAFFIRYGIRSLTG
jgi:threonine/homoserine/homoserine lactone efflux protein